MTEIPIDTSIYEREHGGKPKGKGYWRFRLSTYRVTEKDHFVNSAGEQSYATALQRAQDVATARRSSRIVVLP